MPELPEVETVKKHLLRSGIVGSRIIDVEIFWDKSVTPDEFKKLVSKQIINNIGRKGKYLFFKLKNEFYIFFHLRMSGRIFFNSSPRPHDRVILYLSEGNKIIFNDTRKFGRISLVKDPETIFRKLGPEPLEKSFTLKYLKSRFNNSRKTVKSLLLDQAVIAGIGNIYADEALFAANIHPETLGGSITDRNLKKLLKSSREVLKKGIKNGGTSLGKSEGNFFSPQEKSGKNQFSLQVYGRQGKQCGVCNNTILKIKVAGRGTHYCPTCQKSVV